MRRAVDAKSKAKVWSVECKVQKICRPLKKEKACAPGAILKLSARDHHSRAANANSSSKGQRMRLRLLEKEKGVEEKWGQIIHLA